MAGKEYTAKDKIFSKMTREGLTEETLQDGSVKKISQKSRDEQLKERMSVYSRKLMNPSGKNKRTE